MQPQHVNDVWGKLNTWICRGCIITGKNNTHHISSRTLCTVTENYRKRRRQSATEQPALTQHNQTQIHRSSTNSGNKVDIKAPSGFNGANTHMHTTMQTKGTLILIQSCSLKKSCLYRRVHPAEREETEPAAAPMFHTRLARSSIL